MAKPSSTSPSGCCRCVALPVACCGAAPCWPWIGLRSCPAPWRPMPMARPTKSVWWPLCCRPCRRSGAGRACGCRLERVAVYVHCATIECLFEEVTEVFRLQGLIGATPPACIFQFAFCLLLYKLIQVVRGYVAQGQKRVAATLSTEKLFDDVRRQLTAWYVMLEQEATCAYFAETPTAKQVQPRLKKLCGTVWDATGSRAPHQKVHRSSR